MGLEMAEEASDEAIWLLEAVRVKKMDFPRKPPEQLIMRLNDKKRVDLIVLVQSKLGRAMLEMNALAKTVFLHVLSSDLGVLGLGLEADANAQYQCFMVRVPQCEPCQHHLPAP